MAPPAIDTEVGEETIWGGTAQTTKVVSTPLASLQDLSTPQAAPAAEGRDDEVAPVAVEEEVAAPLTSQTAAEKAQQEEADALEERDFDTNPTVLFAMLQKKEWDTVMERALSHPEEAAIWVSRKEKGGTVVRWKLLPIHAAIVFKATPHVMETLLAAYPQGAATKDDQGMLPLHLAFRNASPPAVVDLLLMSHPTSMQTKDRKGRVPLVLAQASNSPFKEDYLKALAKGPLEYAMEKAKCEKEALLVEQQAIYEAKLVQLQQQHQHDLDAAKLAAAQEHRDLHAQIEAITKEMNQTSESSQVLIDHVSSLEAQLNSRSDTERFLATKIASLDQDLTKMNLERITLESQLKHQMAEVVAERDQYKSQWQANQTELEQVQKKLSEKVATFEKHQLASLEHKKDLEAQLKATRMDWANAQANSAILGAQLKKKMETEHALATQVSSLAQQLAESNVGSRDITNKYSNKIQELEDERLLLRASVQDLTQRLKLVAQVLEDMTIEQATIVQNSQAHEALIASALNQHSEVLKQANAQAEILQRAQDERDEMKRQLERQEVAMKENEAQRAKVMQAIATQTATMAQSQTAREDLVQGISKMGQDVQSVLDNIKSVLPSGLEAEAEDMVDAVVKSITSPAVLEEETPKEEEEEEEAEEVALEQSSEPVVTPEEDEEEEEVEGEATLVAVAQLTIATEEEEKKEEFMEAEE